MEPGGAGFAGQAGFARASRGKPGQAGASRASRASLGKPGQAGASRGKPGNPGEGPTVATLNARWRHDQGWSCLNSQGPNLFMNLNSEGFDLIHEYLRINSCDGL